MAKAKMKMVSRVSELTHHIRVTDAVALAKQRHTQVTVTLINHVKTLQ